jgi:hypothetical protein
MKEYKQEIEATRIGCLGSSDAKMVAQIATLGNVPKSAYERLAVLKGLKDKGGHPYTEAMRFGDRIENEIFAYLNLNNDKLQSNPLWESKKYAGRNFKCISHPDYVYENHDEKCIYVYEVKASKFTSQQVRQEYRCQLYWHHLLAMEREKALGRGWRHKLFLVHYNSLGIEDFDAHEFDVDRLTVKDVRFHIPVFDMETGLELIDAFLDDFNEYYGEDEEIDANLLPEQVYKQFEVVCDTLGQIKQMEEDVETFKQRIYTFMLEKGIKSIKNEYFTISRVDPNESVTFDYKRFLNDESALHPIKVRKWMKAYEKRTKRKGYASIKIKDKKND